MKNHGRVVRKKKVWKENEDFLREKKRDSRKNEQDVSKVFRDIEVTILRGIIRLGESHFFFFLSDRVVMEVESWKQRADTWERETESWRKRSWYLREKNKELVSREKEHREKEMGNESSICIFLEVCSSL